MPAPKPQISFLLRNYRNSSIFYSSGQASAYYWPHRLQLESSSVNRRCCRSDQSFHVLGNDDPPYQFPGKEIVSRYGCLPHAAANQFTSAPTFVAIVSKFVHKSYAHCKYELEAYFVTSALAKSISKIGFPWRTKGSYSTHHRFQSLLTFRADNDSIRFHKIVDCITFPQEFRIRDDIEIAGSVWFQSSRIFLEVPTGTVLLLTTILYSSSPLRSQNFPICSETPST